MLITKRCVFVAAVLMTAVICQSCSLQREAETPVPSAETTETSAEISYVVIDHAKFAKEFIGYLTEFHTEVLGYNIKVTQCAYYLYALTADNRIDLTDPAAVREALTSEISKLAPEMKKVMTANYNAVSALIYECSLDEAEIKCFNDVDKEEEMRKLIYDVNAHNSWLSLKEIMKGV